MLGNSGISSNEVIRDNRKIKVTGVQCDFRNWYWPVLKKEKTERGKGKGKDFPSPYTNRGT